MMSFATTNFISVLSSFWLDLCLSFVHLNSSMPSKPKTKLTKGKAGTPPPTKQPRKATRRAPAHAVQQEPDLVVTEEQFMDYEALPDPSKGMASRLDTMMAMIMERSQNVQYQDETLQEQEDTLSISLSRLQVKRRGGYVTGLPDSGLQHRLEKCLRQAPLVADSISDENSSREEGPITHRKKRTLKPGKDFTGGAQVKKRINWPVHSRWQAGSLWRPNTCGLYPGISNGAWHGDGHKCHSTHVTISGGVNG